MRVLVIIMSLGVAQNAEAAEPLNLKLFDSQNRCAWCIVPFDAKHRTPGERVQMLKDLGFQKYAYDWRAEHLPSFAEEVKLLKTAKIELTAVWFPSVLNADANALLAVIEREKIHPQLWVSMFGGEPTTDQVLQAKFIRNHVEQLAPIADAAKRLGCSVALYNHGGWFGEPENQIAILEALKRTNVGIVYNFHHGHEHLPRIQQLFPKMLPHLLCVNLNGMVPNGEKTGQKIVPIGFGERDQDVLRLLAQSKYTGPIGILGHTQDDAADRLQDNLDGLAWLLPQLEGKPPGPRPNLRTKTGLK